MGFNLQLDNLKCLYYILQVRFLWHKKLKCEIEIFKHDNSAVEYMKLNNIFTGIKTLNHRIIYTTIVVK